MHNRNNTKVNSFFVMAILSTIAPGYVQFPDPAEAIESFANLGIWAILIDTIVGAIIFFGVFSVYFFIKEGSAAIYEILIHIMIKILICVITSFFVTVSFYVWAFREHG